MKTHKNLDVWKRSIEFVTELYKLTKQFPEDERFGLISQLRRAAISVSSNIAEGAARKNPGEFIQYLYIAPGSISEIDTQLIISRNLGYPANTKITDECSTIGKMLINLIKYLKSK